MGVQCYESSSAIVFCCFYFFFAKIPTLIKEKQEFTKNPLDAGRSTVLLAPRDGMHTNRHDKKLCSLRDHYTPYEPVSSLSGAQLTHWKRLSLLLYIGRTMFNSVEEYFSNLSRLLSYAGSFSDTDSWTTTYLLILIRY